MYITKDTENIRKGLSNREAAVLSMLAKDGKSVIGYEDISNTIDTSYQNARKIVERLSKKKWLIQIARGKYLISPLSAGIESKYTEHEFVIASNLAANKQHYIAYWTALNHYGYTEQTPFTVFVAATSRITSTNVHGVNYKFITINKTKFFGTRNHFIGNKKIIISDKNKTIVDALDHPEYCGGIEEVAKCLWNAKGDISFEKIIDYSKKIQNSTVIKRLGYLIDVLEMDVPSSLYDQMRNLIGSGRSLLNPHSAKNKKSNLKWKLFVNTSTDAILEAKSTT